MDEKQDDDGLRDMLAGLAPEPHARRSVPTDLRKRIRDDYDAIQAARQREVTWQQITLAMVKAGVRASDGSEPSWRTVMSAYHAERYTRGEKRQRRRKSTPTPETSPLVPPRAASPSPVPISSAEEDAPPPATEGAFKSLRRSAGQAAPLLPTPSPQPLPQKDADETIARLMGRKPTGRPLMPPIPKPQPEED